MSQTKESGIAGSPPADDSTADAPGIVPDEAVSMRAYRVIRYAVLAALVLSCALSLSLNLVDPDLWGHVKYGQELLNERELPRLATHTFTAPETPWINHENLAEIVMALGYEYLGAAGLLVAKCLLGMGILGLMVLTARWHGVGILAAWGMMLLIATNLTAFFPLRPQLLSFAWCALMLLAVDRAFTRWHRREIRFKWLWCVPPLFVLWVNSHGAWVAGLAILLTYLVGRSVELAFRNRRGRPVRRPMAHLSVVAATTSLATLATPYGFHLLIWIAGSLGKPRPEITEWAPPRPGDPVFIPFLILVGVALLAMFFGRRRRDWTQIAILTLVGVEAAMHLRHIAFFALLCGFWLPPHLMLAIKRLRPSRFSGGAEFTLSPRMRHVAAAGLAGVFLIQGFALAKRLTRLPVYRNSYPVDAFDFMAEQGIDGKLVVAFNWAQYAIAAFAPDVEVQFDGRFRTCYPQEIVDAHFDFLLGAHGGLRYRNKASGAIDGTRALEMGEPDLVLIDRKHENAVAVIAADAARPDSSWVLLYQDGVAQLWGRRQRFDHPGDTDYIRPEARVISDRMPQGSVTWPALPQGLSGRFSVRSDTDDTS